MSLPSLRLSAYKQCQGHSTVSFLCAKLFGIFEMGFTTHHKATPLLLALVLSIPHREWVDKMESHRIPTPIKLVLAGLMLDARH